MRDSLESSVYRHGDIEDLSAVIEKGEKPPYPDFVNFMEGKTNPEINFETTEATVKKRVDAGKLNNADFDTIICSPAKRAQSTASVINKVLETRRPVRVSPYLKEAKIPMGNISAEDYQAASNISEVRQKVLEAFLAGDKLDENIVDVYRRAERFLIYVRRIRRLTEKKPLFLTHGIFLRFLDLAMKHEGQNLSDGEIQTMVQKELLGTKRPGTFEGIKIQSNAEGIKSIGIL